VGHSRAIGAIGAETIRAITLPIDPIAVLTGHAGVRANAYGGRLGRLGRTPRTPAWPVLARSGPSARRPVGPSSDLGVQAFTFAVQAFTFAVQAFTFPGPTARRPVGPDACMARTGRRASRPG